MSYSRFLALWALELFLNLLVDVAHLHRYLISRNHPLWGPLIASKKVFRLVLSICLQMFVNVWRFFCP